MRCTFKVVARRGIVLVDRLAPYYSDKDTEAVKNVGNDMLKSWDTYVSTRISRSEKDGGITKSAERSVTRAMRYDSWCYIRFNATTEKFKDGTSGIRFSISTSDVNNADAEVLEETRKAAVHLAEIIVGRREISSDIVKRHIVFDEKNEFFAEALRTDMEYREQRRKEEEERKLEEEKKRVEKMVEDTTAQCPHEKAGRCLIHERGCPYFCGGQCEIVKRRKASAKA